MKTRIALIISVLLVSAVAVAASAGQWSWASNNKKIKLVVDSSVTPDLVDAVDQSKDDWNALKAGIKFVNNGQVDGTISTVVLPWASALDVTGWTVSNNTIVYADGRFVTDDNNGGSIYNLTDAGKQHVACRMLGKALGLSLAGGPAEADSCMDGCSLDTDMDCLNDPAKTTPGAQDKALLESMY